jgi:hypothetical protein
MLAETGGHKAPAGLQTSEQSWPLRTPRLSRAWYRHLDGAGKAGVCVWYRDAASDGYSGRTRRTAERSFRLSG